MVNRRTLLQGIAALGAGLILPPTLAENVQASRRYWALGAMPDVRSLSRHEQFIRWVEAMDAASLPIVGNTLRVGDILRIQDYNTRGHILSTYEYVTVTAIQRSSHE